MKISNEVRYIYDDQRPLYVKLQERVEELLQSKKDNRWHFEGRIKALESYALKLETGRHNVNLEDFYACTIVVENLLARIKAEQLVRNEFRIHERRPQRDNFTHKKSDSFPFDDLRLYVSWKDAPGAKPSGLGGIIFEVQIKTFLQHAWAIATHDLIYKSQEKSWPKERIAYQIKAMLEHAEVSIYEATAISKSPALKKSNKDTDRLQKIGELLRSYWPPEALPADILRLSDNISSLLSIPSKWRIRVGCR